MAPVQGVPLRLVLLNSAAPPLPPPSHGFGWLALGEEALAADEGWLAPGEAAVLDGLRYTKRRNEFLLRRLVAKRAVAIVTGRFADPAALAGIEIRNAPEGAPYVYIDGAPLDVGISISDRAGWAVCVTAAHAEPGIGCDIELVEPRSAGFVSDFLTAAEQQLVLSCAPGVHRDVTANLIWSAKESALKALRTGLRRDTRTLEITPDAPRADGWGRMAVHAGDGTEFTGWWRNDGRFLLTVVTPVDVPPPVALGAPDVLASATPRQTWLHTPLHP